MTESSSAPHDRDPSAAPSSAAAAAGKQLRSAPASPSPPPVPVGFHPIRRAMTTLDEGAQPRRRPLSNYSQQGSDLGSPRRRSSTFSDYSLNEARRNLRDDILNPGASASLHTHHQNNLSSIPLAFALLPAVGGLLFKNGSAIVTDVMLLGLAAVFLHWSVTQPWSWYHSAQEIRIKEERIVETVFDDESEPDEQGLPPPSPAQPSSLDDVPEDEEPSPRVKLVPTKAEQAQDALNELYMHEVTALIWCFVFPMLGAYMLHAIRNNLSRPSEGLVSNYNLTIFLLAAEIHPLSHLIKLIQARTLHLQRVANVNPFKQEPAPSAAELQRVLLRLEELESRAASGELAKQNGPNPVKQEAAMVREVRNAIQPELDALNRAVRRYEKKATVLALQTEARLGALDARLDDAITLAAAAAKNSTSRQNLLGWLADRAVWVVMLPIQALLGVLVLPFRAVSGLLWRSRKPYEKSQRDRRGGKSSASRIGSSDRVPSRLSKR